ncbi:type II toxin-antitoxin system ParD family antitoxin [Pseudomonas protegens]|uniref:type II toxin-antitoxin system ParD family antitoxin n=1 Tax=Pseudomonas TaxID=286 RepID=UPI001A932D95|nr:MULTISPECIES: type II toxin-antitoxin system ParD family antitoxin [Pseudomonas]MCE4057161.1 type II toxin-antitoxin system ParD family antitoxin [Pseudomonas sp. Au-Pse12]MCL9657084.1 type II toxin-antitoxin system ParD family antitoxin [Pseudomonas protegens]BCT34133.1 transcriptional regulator [Pseudomonas protegens]
MPTRNVVLTAHQEQLINNLVKSGRYQNASEVMREGLRLLEQRVAEEAAKIEALRQAAAIGIADLQQGRFSQVREENLQHYLDELGLEAVATDQEKH